MPLKKLLIIFYRNPELGKVKSRLAKTLGEEKTLAIYLHLASHTQEVTKGLKEKKWVFYDRFIDREDFWENSIFEKRLQQGVGLGERMEDAFRQGFQAGFNSIVIIGTDCYALTSSLLEQAFDFLETQDAILGPARDGGYYALGLRSFHACLFQGKPWGKASVGSLTVKDFEKLRWRYSTLPTLSDVDEEKDLPLELISRLADHP